MLFDDGFDRFWAEYPKRVAKKDAHKAWAALQPSGALIDRIVAAVQWQRATPAWADAQFIPYPATWLRAERWEDEPCDTQSVLGKQKHDPLAGDHPPERSTISQSLTVPAAMTAQDFGLVFAKLAIQLQWRDADELSIRSYYEVLHDLPLWAILASASAFAREPGRKFFPTAPEWHERAAAAATQALRAQLQPDPARGWVVECSECDDTGWRHFECPADRCDRPQVHAPHSFVRVCPCRATNLTYQRHQVRR